MRKRIWLAAIATIVVLLVYNVASVIAKGKKDVPEEKLQIIEGATYNVLDQAHLLNLKYDDAYSKKVFDQYFNILDYEKKYFTQEDFQTFDQYSTQLDDELKESDLTFFNLVDSIYLERLNLTEGWFQEILNEPFDYNIKEQVASKVKEIPYEKDLGKLKERWRKLLKQRSLIRYTDVMSSQAEKADSLKTAGEFKTPEVIEKEARESTQKIFDRYYKRLRGVSLQDRYAIFLNAYLEMVDPHTGYFPPADKENFDVSMSGSFYGIGAQLRSDEDQTLVERIIVGSPCYKQGALKKGDIIEKVAQGTQVPVDISGMFLDDVVKMIRGKKGTEVRLTVKHIDGKKEVVPIIRDKVDLEDTYVKSAILKDGQKKIGYISLPEFYFDTKERDGRTCFKDMKAELINLKSEKLDGIIIDLRNNGGGSLSDVVKIVGLFIQEGPVVRVVDRSGDSKPLRDDDFNVYYDGPLTILVNEGSASASEIMAAALQDYNRATIIGTTTFGKGTVQQFVDLQRVVPRQVLDNFLGTISDDDKQLGSVKLTIQKFYRINGGSTQRKGVTPDIVLPDLYEYIDRGERQISSALPWDSIPPSKYVKVASDGWNRSQIRKMQNFVQASDYFNDILTLARFLKSEDERVYTPLDYADFLKNKNERDAAFKKLEKYSSDSTEAFVDVVNPAFRLKQLNKDSASVEKNKNWLDAISKDHYINVAMKYFDE